jgi:hypothetical protein
MRQFGRGCAKTLRWPGPRPGASQSEKIAKIVAPGGHTESLSEISHSLDPELPFKDDCTNGPEAPESGRWPNAVLAPIDPIKALFWSAVVIGVVAVPIMIVTMLMAANPRIMGQHRIAPILKALGWLSTLAMAQAPG